MIRVWKISENTSEEIHLENQLSLDDVTRQLPNGYYSTFRTYDSGSRVLGLKSHLRRLYEPVDKADVNATQLRRNLIPLLEHFLPEEARVRAIMTEQGQIYIALQPLKPLPPEVYDKGVRVETVDIQRNTPRLKSTAFISMSDSERGHLAQEGIFEALLVKDGKILEGMTSNFFYVAGRDGIPPYMGTAQDEILLGVTRETVIRLARGRGVEIRYQPLKLNQLSEVSESFITSSSRGVVPVIQINEITVGQGRPGPVTQMLISAYGEYVLKHAEKI